MLRLTPSPPVGVRAGQKWRNSANPPHAERIHVGVVWRGTGERVAVRGVRLLPCPEHDVSEQPDARIRSAAHASTALTIVDRPYLRMPGRPRSEARTIRVQPASRRPRCSIDADCAR
jgi:hypothetical protein